MLTRGCEYGLQAMLYLASQKDGIPVFQRDISHALGIPPHFLGKILQMLARNRLVISQKGKSGGFVLSRPANQIAPYEIIQAIDGPVFLDGCLLGFPGCSDDTPCPVHNKWKQIKSSIIQMLQEDTLQQLSEELSPKLDSIRQHYQIK